MNAKDVVKAYELLKTYRGDNYQILYSKINHERTNNELSEFEVKYILANFDYIKKDINKIVKISDILGQKLKDKYKLEFIPEKIRISSIIGEMGGTYHCYVQFRKSVPESLMYISKAYILNPLQDTDYKSVDVDFNYFDKLAKTQRPDDERKLKIHQKEGIQFLLANKKCILADSMGLGKEQPIDTKIATPDGYIFFGNLKVGDKIFGSDGKTYNITGIFPQGLKDIYEIEFTDGSKTQCGIDHLWLVKTVNHIRRGKGWQVKSLRQIMSSGLEWSNGSNGYHSYKFRIPICQPVECTEKQYIIHPYLLGLMIGDGNLCSGRCNISIPDTEIETVDRINSLLDEKYTLSESRSGSCPKYSIVRKTEHRNDGLNENVYTREVKFLRLDVKSNQKFIPEQYKFGSIEQRINLLQGLMDSDGHISRKDNKISYSTTSITLANDIVELVQGLGGIATIRQYDRAKENKSVEYNISVKLKINPFKLKNKRNRYTIDDTHKKYLVKSIKSVKLLDEKKECMCIKVDSPDESYLTNNYIVTHNTTTAVVSTLAANAKKILIICPATLKLNWKHELQYYENPENIQVISGSKWNESKKFTIINYDIIDNFYKLPTEGVFETQIVSDGNGGKREISVPVMIKSKSNGKLVQKQAKSRKKDYILECMSQSKLITEKFDCVIIDEAQKLSNNTSNRYKVIEDFLKRNSTKYVFLLTGTPISNNPKNLYNLLHLLDADITKDYNFYMTRYCGGREIKLRSGRKVMTARDATNLDELKERIKHLYIRRLATDVPDMVTKTISTRYYDLNAEQFIKYKELWDEYVLAQEDRTAEETEEYRQLVEGTLVRKYLATEMVNNTIQLAKEILEDGEKVVIVCTYQHEVDAFKDYFKDKAVVYDGRILSGKKKDLAVKSFMDNPKIKVFIGNLNAASTGLTLTSASKMIFNSYSWEETANRQMQDRIWRLTQTKDCECIYQLWTDSISQDMFEKVIRKGVIMDTVIKKENDK